MRSLNLDEKDFQKFIAQYEGEEGYWAKWFTYSWNKYIIKDINSTQYNNNNNKNENVN